MKTYLFLMMILLSAASISADNYNEYLEASRKHLAEGNKEKAESCYRIYTNMTGKKDAELEKAFSGSAQSGNIEYRVVLTMTEKYENGDVYEGEEKDGIRHGIGRYYHTDGAIYEGEWKDDLIHGIGRYYYPDGAAENVLCENGKIVGSTKETLPQSEIRIHSIGYDNDDLYHGNMQDGKRNGRGTMHYADRRKYVGEWKDDKYHGYGVLTHKNRDQYEGYFVNDKYNGQGTYYYADGDRYEGEFKDNKYNGQGTYYWANGNRYEGEFKDDKYNGQGTFYFASGNRYEGEWQDGKRHGQGTMYFKDGTSKSGRWEMGKFVE